VHWQLPVSQQPQQPRVTHTPTPAVGRTTDMTGTALSAAQSNAIFIEPSPEKSVKDET